MFYFQSGLDRAEGKANEADLCEPCALHRFKLWEIIDTDFYNLSFNKLADKRIEFISSKVYQSFPGEIARERNLPVKQSSILIAHKDYRKVHDPNFDPLEYRGERTPVNWPIQTDNLYPYYITNIIFQIKYMEHEYRFNIIMVNEK